MLARARHSRGTLSAAELWCARSTHADIKALAHARALPQCGRVSDRASSTTGASRSVTKTKTTRLFAARVPLAPALVFRHDHHEQRAAPPRLSEADVERLSRLALIDVKDKKALVDALSELLRLCEQVLEVAQGTPAAEQPTMTTTPLRRDDDRVSAVEHCEFVSSLAPRFTNGFVVAPPAVKSLASKAGKAAKP